MNKEEYICDLNVEFIKRWISYRSRTQDQMEQAGRLARRKALREASTNSSQSRAVSLGGKKRVEYLKVGRRWFDIGSKIVHITIYE